MILRDFKFSVYILLLLSVFMHKELFSFYRWDLLPVRAFVFATLCAGLLHIYMRYISRGKFLELFSKLKEPFVAALVFLWLVTGVSILFTKNLQASIALYGFFTAVVSVGIYMYFSLRENAAQVLDYVKFYVYLAFGLTLFGYAQLFLFLKYNVILGALWNVPENLPRIGSIFWDVNHYGAFLATLLPVIAALVLIQKRFKSFVIYALMFVSVGVGVFLTNSRTSWILAGVSFIVSASVLLFKKIGVRGIIYVIIGLLAVSAPLVYSYSIKSSPFRAAIKQYFHYRMDSYDSHFLLLQGAVEIFDTYPFFGGGYGSFFEHFSETKVAPTFFGRDPAALSTRVPAHTLWGEIIAETGIFGLTGFIALSGIILLTLLYVTLNSSEAKIYLVSATMFSSIIGLFVAGIFYSYNTEFFWLILFLYFIWAYSVRGPQVSFTQILQRFMRQSRVLLLVMVIVAGLLIFVNLGGTHLVPWDEAIYAKISKNMVLGGNWLDMVWKQGHIWYEKPPLYMWMMAGFMQVLGITEWAARLPSAIFGFLSIVIVFVLGSKWFSKTTGFISALVLLTTVHFLYYSRSAMTDVTTTFFILLAIYLYSYAKDKGHVYWLLSGVAIGLAVIVKGVVGLLPFPILGLYEIYALATGTQKFSKKLVGGYITLGLAALAIFLPWHIYMYSKYGTNFLGNYIGYHVWDRATTAIEDKGKPFLWYFTVMRVSMRIWFLAFLPAMVFGLYKTLKKDSRYALLSIWTLFTFLFFSVAKSKLIWYIIPVYPAAALLAGNFIDASINFVLTKFKNFNFAAGKYLAIFIIFIGGLFYLFLNRNLAYPQDLTGPQVRLLQAKDAKLGTFDTIYVDRIEEPLVMFYTNSPYKIIDFVPDKRDRVPSVDSSSKLVLLTKFGRYSEQVVGKNYAPHVIQKDGDWILWYFDSQVDHDKKVAEEAAKVAMETQR